jgi:phage terminase large subunit-like protein
MTAHAGSFPAFAASIGLPLEPFQRRIGRALCSDVEEVVVLLPRGNGKTTLLAAYALWHLLQVEDGRVNFTAGTREQAAIAYEAAVGFAHRLGDDRLHATRRELHFRPDPGSRRFTRFMRVRPGEADALQGLDSTLAVIDELHTATDSAPYVAMVGSLKAPGAKLRIISTAAPSADSPLGRLRARALALPTAKRHGAVVEAKGPNLHLLEWSCRDGTELTDRRAILGANPASWRDWPTLRKRRDAVPESSFRRFFMNQHAAIGESTWLPAGAWAKCRADYAIEDGERVFCGIDIGGTRAATALVYLTDDLRVGVETWEGEEAVIYAEAALRELAERYVITEAAFDPWRFGAQALDLSRQGLRMVQFPQHDSRLVPASERLSAAILERRLRHPGDPVLDQHVAAAVAKQTRRGARIAHAGGRHTANRIDAVIALAMAVDRAENQPEPVRLVGWL